MGVVNNINSSCVYYEYAFTQGIILPSLKLPPSPPTTSPTIYESVSVYSTYVV